jgi:anti-sigma B factor antagonist
MAIIRDAMTLKEREIGDVTVLDLAGRLVLDEGDTLVRMRVNELIIANRVKIIANLHDVTYIDSCGLGVLVAKLVSVRNKGGDLRLLHLSPRTARVFAISKLENVFETFDSEDQAVASFAESPGR